MSTQDDDLMATLTDEERAAMAEEDDEAAGTIVDDGKPAAITTTTDDEDDDGPADPNVPPIEGKPAAPEPAAKTEPEPVATATADEPGEQEPLTQQYRAELPADFDDRVAAISTRTTEIQQKFNDGEIDLAERDTELGKVNADRDELNRVRARVESLQEINTQNAQASWQRQIANFMSAAAKEASGIDYRTDAAKAKDLDKYVKILAADDDNAERDGTWFLAEAHKLVKNKYGIVDAPKPAKTDAERIAEAKAARKPAIDAAPKNLAAVPGSDGPGDVEGEFADVEALEGQELEDAIARMTPGQRQKFLAS